MTVIATSEPGASESRPGMLFLFRALPTGTGPVPVPVLFVIFRLVPRSHAALKSPSGWTSRQTAAGRNDNRTLDAPTPFM